MNNKKRLFLSAILLLCLNLIFISVVKAADSYSIEYLIKHYNAVVLGVKDNNIISDLKNTLPPNPKGNITNLTVEGDALVKGNYDGKVNENIDFEKLYSKVVNESELLVENAKYHLNTNIIEINNAGIYTINNTELSDFGYWKSILTAGDSYYDLQKSILINNYSPNNYYVFNIMDDESVVNYKININDPNNGTIIGIKDLIESGNYNGNIILNFPNARYVRSNYHYAHIIAPKADVLLETNRSTTPKTEYYGTIVANSISETRGETLHSAPSKLTKPLLDIKSEEYSIENKDYSDDIYAGDYSILSILKNYSIVSLGQKDYQSNTKLKELGYKKGSVGVFHITGQFLINGDLGVENYEYPGYIHEWMQDIDINGYMRLDLDSNEIGESHLSGSLKSPYYIKFWNNETSIYGTKNDFYHKGNNFERSFQPWSAENKNNGYITIKDNYINYKRLYDNIVAEQAKISEGETVTAQNGVIHIPTGGTYTIDDISGVSEIIFDDFYKNKDSMTIITIKNSGKINFPKVSKDKGGYKGILTNDYYGKDKPTQVYELDEGLIEDDYHGNIIFNLPDANYIKLAPNAPFAGHIIAPNADVETEETQIAGAMIVNSFYAEGGTELHFYPLSLTGECDCHGYDDLTVQQQRIFNKIILSNQLGGEGSIIEELVLGDSVQFEQDKAEFDAIYEACYTAVKTADKARNDTINPKTIGSISILIVLAFMVSGGTILYINKKQKGNA